MLNDEVATCRADAEIGAVRRSVEMIPSLPTEHPLVLVFNAMLEQEVGDELLAIRLHAAAAQRDQFQ
jgi:hypothetical protein